MYEPTLSFICHAGLFQDNAGLEVSNELTPQLIDAAVTFVEMASSFKQHKKKNVYKNALGDTVTSERLRVILDRKWLSDDVSTIYISCRYF